MFDPEWNTNGLLEKVNINLYKKLNYLKMHILTKIFYIKLETLLIYIFYQAADHLVDWFKK